MASRGLSNEKVVRALNFHGQQLTNFVKDQAIFRDLDLKDVDYHLYQSRSKELRMEDRGKRLLLHRFISSNMEKLFQESKPPNLRKMSKENEDEPRSSSTAEASKSEKNQQQQYLSAVLPPFETFTVGFMSEESRLKAAFEVMAVGDVLYAKITAVNSYGMLLNVCCFASCNLHPKEKDFKRSKSRYLNDLRIRCFCPTEETVLPDGIQGLKIGQFVLVTILEVRRDQQRLLCGMKKESFGDPELALSRLHDMEKRTTLGLLENGSQSLPQSFALSLHADDRQVAYDKMLGKSPGFVNPTNVEVLVKDLGLSEIAGGASLMTHIGNYPRESYSDQLRQRQSANAAFRHVEVGVKHFKAGETVDAFQCLNMALKLDPANVEGLVARGALYANGGSLGKAVEDFERALEIRPTHKNANKYWKETSMARAKGFLDEEKYGEAREIYLKILEFDPNDECGKAHLCTAMIKIARQQERDGKVDEAIQTYKAILGFDPENRDAKDSIWYLSERPKSFPMELHAER